MSVETTVRRIGNSQGVTIPKDMCKLLGLTVGSCVRIDAGSGFITLRPTSGATLSERMAEWDGVRYRSPEFDWGEPAGKEMW